VKPFQSVPPGDSSGNRNLVPTKVLLKRLGVSRTTMWRIARRDPSFPVPVNLPTGMQVFVADEVDRYVDGLIARRADANETAE
jgi:predicted DNA-binding transcriptional regulator AlpA